MSIRSESDVRPNIRVQLTGHPDVPELRVGNRIALSVGSIRGTDRPLRPLGLQLTPYPFGADGHA